MVSLGVFAQWTKPTLTVADGAKLQISDENDTICYYLYNIDADAFYTEGNDYGTRLSFTHDGPGLKCFFSMNLVENEETGELGWDGKTILFHNYSIARSRWDFACIESENSGYVDWNNRYSQFPNYMWECEKDENSNLYRFFGADANPTYNHTNYPNTYLGIDTDYQETILRPCLELDGVESEELRFVNWILVPVDCDYFSKLEVYNTAVELGAYIEEVKGNDYADVLAADIAKAEAVYNNTSSTAEELNAARTALITALGYASLKGASEDNPKDATVFIKNATFDKNIDGWVITVPASEVQELGWLAGNPSRPGQAHYNSPDDGVFIDNAIQVWGAGTAFPDGKMYQIMPSLPQGKYEFTVDACAVIEGNIGTACEGIELYAIGGEYEVSQNISTGEFGPKGQGTYYGVKKFKVTFISTGGDIELGAKFENTTCNWIALDNFTLTYFGETEDDPDRVMLLDLVNKCEEKYGDVDEVAANGDIKEEYIDLIDEAKTASEGYMEIRDRLSAAADALGQSINDYKDFAALIEEVEVKVEEYDAQEGWEELAGDLSDLMMEWEDEYNNETADGEYIKEQKEKMNTLIEEAKEKYIENLRKNLKDGSDLTVLLVNPGFEDGLNGWTVDENYATPDCGGNDNNKVVEKWMNNFSIYQDVTDLPDGVYQVLVQGYFRPSGDGVESVTAYHQDKDGENEKVSAYLSANETSKKFRHIGTESIFETFDGRVVTTEIDGKTYYIPDNMPAAATVFQMGAYENDVCGVVTNGTLRIGARALTGEGGRWTVFDNFRVVYRGMNASEVRKSLVTLVSESEVVADNLMEASLKDALDKAISQATAALAGEADGETLFAIYKTLAAAVQEAEESVEAYKQLIQKLEELEEALSAYAETAAPDVLSKANTAFGEYCTKVEMGEYTTAQCAEVIAQVTDYIGRLKMPSDYNTASDDDPYDFTGIIVNPSFDLDGGSTTGWELYCELGLYSNMQCQKNDKYPGDEPVIDLFAEIWRAGSPLGDAYIRQELLYLPVGTYMLEADVIACDQSYDPDTAENPYEIVGAELYVQEGATEVKDTIAIQTPDSQPEHYGLIFKKESDSSSLIIGLRTVGTNANWLACDNFHLTYYGTESKHEQTGVENVNVNENVNGQRSAEIYNLAGQRLSAPQRGINIISGKKVLVK